MSVDLNLSVDRRSDVALGTQLAWKLRTLIATGQLDAGARLPGIREIAELAGVNINTVRSVLAKLEEQGLVLTQQGRGNFVAANAHRHAALAQLADTAIAQAQAVGLDPRELAAALYISPRTSLTPALEAAREPRSAVDAPPPDPRAERRKLRAEIDQLELELVELEPPRRFKDTRIKSDARILTTAELRETRDALAKRIDALHHERLEWRLERRLAAESDATENRRRHRWRAGVWTGRSAADVSWTTT